jgi:hypothetical protein
VNRPWMPLYVADFARANRRLFEAKCRAAGMSTVGPMSPGLIRALGGVNAVGQGGDPS